MTNQLSLEQIGAEAIRLMTGADRDVAKAQAHIKQVWDAFTAAEEAGTIITINGVSLKKDWAKLINRTTRYCQMIARDGSRERSEKKQANRVRVTALKDGQTVTFELLDENDKAFTGHFRITLPEGVAELSGNKLDRRKVFGSISIEMIEQSQAPQKPKKERLRHIPHPKFSGIALCDDITLNVSNEAKGRRFPATCKKCIELASQLPSPAPKVKKIRAADTTAAIEAFLRPLTGMTRDEFIAAGCAVNVAGNVQLWVETKFEEEVAAHPEWNTGRVEKARRELLEHHARVKKQAQERYQSMQVAREEEESASPIKIALTKAQKREVDTVQSLTIDRDLVYSAKNYEEDAKKLIFKLEERKAALGAEYKTKNIPHKLLEWMNRSEEAKAARKLQAQYNGAVKAIDAAIEAIAFGDWQSDDPTRSIHDWLEQRREEQYEAKWRERNGNDDSVRGADPNLLKTTSNTMSMHPAAQELGTALGVTASEDGEAQCLEERGR